MKNIEPSVALSMASRSHHEVLALYNLWDYLNRSNFDSRNKEKSVNVLFGVGMEAAT